MKRAQLALLTLLALPAAAAPWRPAGAKIPPTSFFDRFAFDVSAGYFDMLGARDSAAAVFGSAGGFTVGGDVSCRLGRSERWFVTLGVRFFGKDGERVFVADPAGPVFKLGHPLEASLVPIHATLGYRFKGKRLLGKRFTPYAGAGLGLTSYSEKSTVGGVTEEESLTKFGAHGLLGAELGDKHVRFAVEAGYSFVPSAIGVAGVSKVYGETDIGGFSLVGKIVLTRSRR